MKKIMIIVIISILTTGCYYTELNDLSIIDSIGIEKKDNSLFVTMSTINTLEYKSEDNMKINIYTSSGNTIEEAINNFYLEINKTIYLDSINNLLLSDTLNHKDIEEITNFFINNKNSRNTFNVIYIKDSNINDILDNNINLKSLLLTNNNEFGNSSLYSFEDFYIDNNTYSFIPTITYKDKIIINNYSVFKKYKYIDTLSKDESIVYNIINNKVNNINITIDNTYLKITDITSLIRDDNKKINISSKINKNDINKYNSYLNKNINNINKKYNLYKDYDINIKTKYIKE